MTGYCGYVLATWVIFGDPRDEVQRPLNCCSVVGGGGSAPMASKRTREHETYHKRERHSVERERVQDNNEILPQVQIYI